MPSGRGRHPELGDGHSRLHPVVLVFFGGVAGTLVRYLAEKAVTPVDGFPAATLAVNAVGCLILGAVAAWATARSGRDRVRLLAGTGFCGGLTTYSAVSWETVNLLREGRAGLAVAYVVVTLVVGVCAAAMGWRLYGRRNEVHQ